jgi:E3 ubiquitin-protein ligase TRIP12
MLARQLRLRLVAAEGTAVPRNCTNITVSIHAIATFQALHDYLRPRIAGAGPGGSRLNGVLAAFAAAAGLPSGSLSRRASALSQALDAAASMPPPSAPSTSTTDQDTVPKTEQPATPTPAVRKPRRSLRLRKEAPPPTDGSAEAETSTAAAGPSGTAAVAPSTLNTAMIPDDFMDDMDQEEDFLGDDFEAEVYDDTPSVNQEKTVSLAVAEGMS